MSNNDLQADITTRLKGNGLTQATQGVDKLKQATDKLSTSQRDLQRQSGRSLGGMRLEAKLAKSEVDRLNRSLQALDGPLGGVSRKLFSAFGIGGGIGIAAGGVVAATAGLAAATRILNMSVDANVEKTRRQIEARRQLTDALEAARKTAAQGANAAGSQNAMSIRQAEARLGAGGFEDAMQFAQTSPAGISGQDAVRGFGEASLIKGDGSKHAVSAAEKVAATGEMGFSEAIAKIRSDPFLLQMAKEGRTREIIGKLIMGARGQDDTNENFAAAMQSVESVMPTDADLVGGGRTGNTLSRVNRLHAGTVEQQNAALDNFRSGMGEGELAESVRRTRDPTGMASAQVMESLQRIQREQIEIEKAHGLIYNNLYRKLEQLGLKHDIRQLPSLRD